VPLEDQAATTSNLGLGTPFAGNLEVYPLYRMDVHVGVEASPKPQASSLKPLPTFIRGVLFLPEASSHKLQATSLMDIAGREVMKLKPGVNDVRGLSPGVYFVQQKDSRGQGVEDSRVTKVVVTR
jgi:hypothetical protein